jgi:SAM-dependent methyltransferase
MAGLTPQRTYLETVLLPRFAARFAADAVVLNVGAGRHVYRDYFRCPVRTADRSPDVGCDAVFPVEAIPYPDASVDGILFNGVFERVDDPMQAMRELRRVLKPTGALLFGAAGLDFDWRVDRDRWRLSPGGFQHVLSAFRVLEEQRFDHVYQYAVVQ